MSILDELYGAVISKDRLMFWVKNKIQKIRVNELRNCVENNLFFDLFMNHYGRYTQSSILSPVIRFGLKIYWQDIESFLCSVKNVYNLLCENEEVKKILSTPQGIKWLNWNTKANYNKLWGYVWK